MSSLTYDQLIERFVKWAETQPDIRAAVIIGSRARVDHPADDWSDLDIVVVTTDPEHYLSKADWLENIGSYWLTFIEPTAAGNEKERRVLFKDSLGVDFAIIHREKVQKVIQDGQVAGVFRRGMRVLLDKDGITSQLTPSSAEPPSPHPPSHSEFLEVVNDFWYHAVWTAKKLRRGELWTAKACSDSYMKWRLIRMMEWHARSMKGWGYDTWHSGRFLEEWADPRPLEGLRSAFAYYNKDDVWRGLLATMELFRWVAVETADRLKYQYPTVADEGATELVKTYLWGDL